MLLILKFMLRVPICKDISFVEIERNILQKWETEETFHKQLELTKSYPLYRFMDGPPFATGLPHHGHLLAGTLKDVVTRYWSMRGFHVPRVFAWDTHGLPVEYEVDKVSNITNRSQIMEMGIDEYCSRCRSTVMKYSSEWRDTITRIGRLIDFDNSIKTMDIDYMETVWNVFYKLWNKSAVYRGIKIMPYSYGCKTSLSNFEASQNYREIETISIVVKFTISDSHKFNGINLLVWTTTPWTLPSNLALCVNPTETYVILLDNVTNEKYIMMKSRIKFVYPKVTYTILDEFEGKELSGLHYIPLFDYFVEKVKSFTITCDPYVTSTSGTGIVHLAPYFGEDDYRICIRDNVIDKHSYVVCPVDDDGNFTDEVREYVGRNVFETSNDIIRMLNSNGYLVKRIPIKHSYPYCYRSNTPLIYRAMSSWFVNIEDIKDRLIENNRKSRWNPSHVQTNRFHSWLENARDWAISRNRYWGNPIPLWISSDGEIVICIGSISELERLSGVSDITDLHIPTVDKITIPDPRGDTYPPLRRISEVFDCWFESGCMPYAKSRFEGSDYSGPVDFIAEGLDQTRGWFYTLLVLTTYLDDDCPAKNVIVNGLVLAEDGQKMSKSKANYESPDVVLEKYGADALRLFFINSPASHGDNVAFNTKEIERIIKSILIPTYSTYYYLTENVIRLGDDFTSDLTSDDLMNLLPIDHFILSSRNEMVRLINEAMENYKLEKIISILINFINDLSLWYIKLDRSRSKGSDGKDSQILMMKVLFNVFYDYLIMLCPFAPFITEYIYDNMKRVLPTTYVRPGVSLVSGPFRSVMESIHHTTIPTDMFAVDNDYLTLFRNLQNVINLGRLGRSNSKIPLIDAINSVTIISSRELIDSLRNLESYIKRELNSVNVVYETDDSLNSVIIRAKPREFGKKYGRVHKDLMKLVESITINEARDFVSSGKYYIPGYDTPVELCDIDIKFTVSVESDDIVVVNGTAYDQFTLLLDITETEETLKSNLIRSFNKDVQQLRKSMGLRPGDSLKLHCDIQCPEEWFSDPFFLQTLDLLSKDGTLLTIRNIAVDGYDKLCFQLMSPE